MSCLSSPKPVLSKTAGHMVEKQSVHAQKTNVVLGVEGGGRWYFSLLWVVLRHIVSLKVLPVSVLKEAET